MGLLSLDVKAAQVDAFSPTGSVKQVQQVVTRFSADMVAMGDSRTQSDPFTMVCRLKGPSASGLKAPPAEKNPKYTTRWVDSRNWVLEFEKPLREGMRCVFQLKAGTKSLSGEELEGFREYAFATAGATLLKMSMSSLSYAIEPDQYFVALADSSMDTKSVEAKAYFEVQGVPDKIGVKVVEGADREAVVKAAIKDDWELDSYNKFIKKNPSKAFSQIREMDNLIVLAGTRRFPEGAKVVLHWPKGILSETGWPGEEARSFDYKVIGPFRAEFSCERSAFGRPCNPLLDMRLDFTRVLPLKSLKGTKLVSALGQTWIPSEMNIGSKSVSHFENEQISSLTFKGPFPASTEFKVILPEKKLKDELGRPLVNQKKFPLKVETGEYSPLIKFAAPFGILESKADPVLPVSVRNIEKQMDIRRVFMEGKMLNLSSQTQIAEIIGLYQGVLARDKHNRGDPVLSGEHGGDEFQIPKPQGEHEFEVVGIPLRKPGFYVVQMKSRRLGEALGDKSDYLDNTTYVTAAALVTDMAVHFKKGRESSLVWVTQLSDAQPVGGAHISLVDVLGKEIAKGKTNNDGFLRLENIDYSGANMTDYEDEGEGLRRCYDEGIYTCEVFVFARKGDDISFVSSRWDKGIETYRFNVDTEYLSRQWGPVVMHTILDRMVAQPGETISMKHIMREHRETGFAMINKKNLPKKVLIVHQGSRKTYTLPFEFDKLTGSAVGTFSIPKDVAIGRYSIYLSNKGQLPSEGTEESESESESFDWAAQETGHFIVSEYRLPLMKATVKIQEEPLVQPSEVKVDLSANYLSGGPAKGLKVRLRASLQPGFFTPDVPDGREYNFLASPIKTGIIDSKSTQSSEGTLEETFLKVQDLTLDENGGLLSRVPHLPPVTKLQRLVLEMEYTDPSGEVKTASSQASVFPGEYVIGLRSDNWYVEPGKAKVLGIITDHVGRPKSHHPYVIEAFRTNHITHRKRLVGGFYSYDSKSEIIALGKVCEGKSDKIGRFKCEPGNLPVGSLFLQAKTVDGKGRTTYASVEMSVHEVGADSWWVPSDSDRIDLIPEKSRYEPGEKAKLVVRSPFLTSKVLVTVEREGVLDAFVTEISRDQSDIEVPLKGHYAPNVFVSVLALRGRVGTPQPTTMLDLARPVMKMGTVELKVGWKAHELLVSVKADKTKYQTKDKVQVAIQVKAATGAKLPAGSEVAVVAVDESLLSLKENTSWKILKEMMGQRGLAVATSSGQNQVIGRRHFGSKAKPPGGSGGAILATDPRGLFEPVLIWQPRLKLDSSGEARITLPLNDSITRFRIVAVATAGENFFGDGSVSVESTKNLIIYSGFAPLVHEGDQIQNNFTLRNTTSQPMRVALEVTTKEISSLPNFSPVDLKPSEAKTLTLPMTIPIGLKEISFHIKAKDALSGNEDGMKAKTRVEPAVPDRVQQATSFQLDKINKITVKQPSDGIAGRGGLSVHVRATLASGLAGVKSYMRDYPYGCLEQKVSRFIVLEDRTEVENLIEALPSYVDAQGLLKFFSPSACGSAQLTRYVMSILKANGYEIPQATQTRLISGLTSYIQGRYVCHSWWDKLAHDTSNETKILLMDTLSMYKSFSPDLLSTVEISPNVWETETNTAWFQLLKRQINIPHRDERLKQVENILRAKVNFQGSLMSFQGVNRYDSWHFLSSPDQAAIGIFGIAIDERSWEQDIARMAKGIVSRLKLGHWDTTTANAWGVTQFRRFSAKFEKEKITGETKVSAHDMSELFNWQSSPHGDSRFLNWPKDSEKSNISVQFSHSGSGKPWIHFETVSAIPLKTPLDMGYKLSRKIVPVMQATPGVWQVGDVANIELTIMARSSQAWVVVRDPIPAGASHLGTGLDGSSNILDRVPKGPVSPAEVRDWPTEYEEKSHAYFISYAAYLPPGTYRVNYRVRLNSAGEFRLPPSRVEALYSPETFGEAPNANWKVLP